MFGYIYETTNLINGKKYIGKRESSVFLGTDYLGSGIRLRSAIHKYGKHNFSVKLIEKCYSRDELNQREYDIIKDKDAVNSSDYYNLIDGGLNGLSGFRHSEESKKLSSQSNKGQVRSDECKLHMSQNHADVTKENNPFYKKRHTEESKRKMSESLKGLRKGWKWYNNGESHNKFEEGKQPEGWILGKLPLSDSTKAKMSKVHRGKIWINNSEVETLINPELLDEYLIQGYSKGRLKRI